MSSRFVAAGFSLRVARRRLKPATTFRASGRPLPWLIDVNELIQAQQHLTEVGQSSFTPHVFGIGRHLLANERDAVGQFLVAGLPRQGDSVTMAHGVFE